MPLLRRHGRRGDGDRARQLAAHRAARLDARTGLAAQGAGMRTGGDPRAALDRLFDEALQREGAERAAFLGAATTGQPQLRAQLEELLALCDSPSPALEPGALHDAGLWPSSSGDADGAGATPGPRPGDRVGAGTRRRALGRGGTGTVVRGERDGGGFPQAGALRLIRTGMGAPTCLERFAQERRILAGFNHPGIARLLDGGQDADGRPWLVMDFIQG